MDLNKAAYFIYNYGNVGRNPEELIEKKPTEAQLLAAENRCLTQVRTAFYLIREHHELPQREYK